MVGPAPSIPELRARRSRASWTSSAWSARTWRATARRRGRSGARAHGSRRARCARSRRRASRNGLGGGYARHSLRPCGRSPSSSRRWPARLARSPGPPRHSSSQLDRPPGRVPPWSAAGRRATSAAAPRASGPRCAASAPGASSSPGRRSSRRRSPGASTTGCCSTGRRAPARARRAGGAARHADRLRARPTGHAEQVARGCSRPGARKRRDRTGPAGLRRLAPLPAAAPHTPRRRGGRRRPARPARAARRPTSRLLARRRRRLRAGPASDAHARSRHLPDRLLDGARPRTARVAANGTRAGAAKLSLARPLLGSAIGDLLESQLVGRRGAHERRRSAGHAESRVPDRPTPGERCGERSGPDRLDVPVTIAGARRPPADPAAGDARPRAPPEARHISLPGCGHVPFSDDSPLVARVLLEGSGG